MSTSFFRSGENNEESWMSISDLMAGLMIIFLFVAIAYIQSIGQEQERLENNICQDLQAEFQNVRWKDRIKICEDSLVIRFDDPETLFERGEANLTSIFRRILGEFFPRYMNVLSKYLEEIDEVRIEGHTDNIWENENDELVKYFKNVKLSQDRTRSVMEFALLSVEDARKHEDWLIENMTANGLSSSKPIRYETGEIDRVRSRRVEFKIRLKTPELLRPIARELHETQG